MVNTVSRRPTSDERRSAMLAAAAEVFFEQGYAASSIDAVIARIGGSKRNIYNEFGSKEGLFTALVIETADQALSALAVEEIEGRDLRETLLELGRRLTAIYMSRTLIGTYRAIISEGQRFPDLARAFYEKGPGRTIERLTEVFEAARARGEAEIADCPMAANHFVAMIRDNIHLQVLLGLRPVPEKAEAEASVAAAVDIFLNGVRKRG
jgi:AcrR family transcriptional regulator